MYNSLAPNNLGVVSEINARSHVALIDALEEPTIAHIENSHVVLSSSHIDNNCEQFSVLKSLRKHLQDMILILYMAPIALSDSDSALTDINVDAETLRNSVQRLVFSGGGVEARILTQPKTEEEAMAAIYIYLLINEFAKHLKSVREKEPNKYFIVFKREGHPTINNVLFEISWRLIEQPNLDILRDSEVFTSIRQCASALLSMSLLEIRSIMLQSLMKSCHVYSFV